MTVTIQIPLMIDGIEDVAELDFDTETYKFTAIIVGGIDFCYTQHEHVMLRLLGGSDNILFKHLQNAIDAKREARDERRGA